MAWQEKAKYDFAETLWQQRLQLGATEGASPPTVQRSPFPPAGADGPRRPRSVVAVTQRRAYNVMYLDS
jgi:hypothetical protein